MPYIIKRDNDTKELVYMQYKLNGYKFKPKNNRDARISIDEIMLVKPSINDKILSISFKNHYDKIVKLIYFILNSDDTNDSDVMLALNEIAKLRSILLNEYQDFLSDELEAEFLGKLRDLENKLRIKMISIHEYDSYLTNDFSENQRIM